MGVEVASGGGRLDIDPDSLETLNHGIRSGGARAKNLRGARRRQGPGVNEEGMERVPRGGEKRVWVTPTLNLDFSEAHGSKALSAIVVLYMRSCVRGSLAVTLSNPSVVT